MQSELTEQAKRLSIPDRILLVEEIWDTIAEENQSFELTDAQKRSLFPAAIADIFGTKYATTRTRSTAGVCPRHRGPRPRDWSNLGRDQS